MPIYEYVCRNCGHELERLQRLSDDPLSQCPECDTPELKRKISAAGFRLAGGGWYETDFKSDGKRNIAGDEKTSKPASSTADTSASGKADASGASSKPAASDKKAEPASKPAKKTGGAASSDASS